MKKFYPITVLTMLICLPMVAVSLEVTQLDLAEGFLAKEKNLEALKGFETFIQNNPASIEIRRAEYGKIKSLLGLKRFKEAGRLLEGVLEELFSATRSRTQAKTYLKLAEEILEASPENDRLAHLKALEFFTAALELPALDPTMVTEFKLLAAKSRLALADWTSLSTARVELEGVLSDSASLGILQVLETRHLLGLVLQKLGESEAAEREVSIVARNSEDPELALRAGGDLLEILGFPYPSQQKLKRARVVIHSLVTMESESPRLAELAFRLAQAELILGEHENALLSLTAYLERWPSGAEAAEVLLRLGEVLIRQTRFSEAGTQLRRLLAEHPGSGFWQRAQGLLIEAEYGVAQLAFSQEKFQEAAKLWAGFVQNYPLDSRTPRAALEIGHCLNKIEDYPGAVKAWRTVWERWPNSHQGQEACLLAARVLVDQLDDYPTARQILEKPAGNPYKNQAQALLAEFSSEALKLTTKEIFLTGTSPEVKLETRNLEKVRVRVYRLDAKGYFRSQASLFQVEKLDVELIKPEQDFWYEIPAYRQYKAIRSLIPLDLTGSGAWVVQTGSETLKATSLVLISDLGLITHASRGELVALTSDLASGRPRSGVKILVLRDGELLIEGKTDANGLFFYRAAKHQAPGSLAVFAQDNEDVAAASPGWFDRYQTPDSILVSHLASERSLWRAGERLQFGLSLRLRDSRGQLTIPKEAFRLQVLTPSGSLAYDKAFVPDRYGQLQGDFVLDPAEPPGEIMFNLRGSEGKLASSHSLTLAEFAPQKSRLEIQQEPQNPIYGETLKLTLSLSELWGEPSAGKEIAYRVNQEEWQSLVTDPAGQARLEIDSSAYPAGETLMLSLRPGWEGQEVSRMIEFEPEQALTLNPLRAVWLDSERPHLSIDSDLPLGDYRVELRTSLLTNGSRILIEKKDLKYEPKVQLDLPRLRPGRYLLQARLTTPAGRSLLATNQLEVIDSRKPDQILILKTQDELISGKKSELKIFSSLERDQEALLVFETDRLVKTTSFFLKRGLTKIRLSPEQILAPKFRLVVLTGTSQGLFQARSEFRVKHALELTIEHRTSYQPGETIRLKFSTRRPDGQPCPAKIFAFVVDSALADQIQVPPLNSGFYPEKNFLAAKSSSFTPFEYHALSEEQNPELLALEAGRAEELQKQAPRFALADFASGASLDEGQAEKGITPLEQWNELTSIATNLGTGQDGVAEVCFELPDRPARWKVLAFACDQGSYFGELESSFDCQSETWLELRLPEQILSGDRLSLPLRLRNHQAKPGRATLSWELESATERLKGELKYESPGAGTHELLLPLPPLKPGSYLLKVSSPGYRTQKKFEVLKPEETSLKGSRALITSSWTKRLQFTPEALGRSLKLKIEPATTGLFASEDNFIGQNQLAGKIALLVKDLARLEFLSGSGSSEIGHQNQLKDSIKARLEHLAILEKIGWKPQPPLPTELAWLGLGLKFAKKAGFSLPRELESGVRKRLEQIYSEAENNELKALALAGLADSEAPFAWANRLYRERDHLGHRELALLALSLEDLGRNDMSRELVDRLARAFIREAGQAYLPGPLTHQVHWMAGSSGTTTLACLALLLRVESREFRDLIKEALAWLESHKTPRGWPNPVENGLIPLIQARYLLNEQLATHWSARVWINGKESETRLSPSQTELVQTELAGNEVLIRVELSSQALVGVVAELSEDLEPQAELQKDFAGELELVWHHPPLYLDGKPIKRGMSILLDPGSQPTNRFSEIARGSPFEVEIGLKSNPQPEDEITVIEFQVPAGLRALGLKDESAVLYREEGPGLIRYLVKTPSPQSKLRFKEEFVAILEGEFEPRSVSVYPLSSPWRVTRLKTPRLKILDPKSDNFVGYRFSADELLAIGKWHYRRGELDQARAKLEQILNTWQIEARTAKEIYLSLLEIALKEERPADSVRWFETLKEAYPDLSISFEEARGIAKAYSLSGEDERSTQVLTGLLEAKFIQDLSLSQAWLKSGQIEKAYDELRRILREYPRENEEIRAITSFARYLVGPEPRLNSKNLSPAWLETQALALYELALSYQPEPGLGSEIALLAASLEFERENWESAQKRAASALVTYPESHLEDVFSHLSAESLYQLGRFEPARRLAETVASNLFARQDGRRGQSSYRNQALLTLAKLNHAENKLTRALQLYESVSDLYPEAGRAIQGMMTKELELAPITRLPVKATSELTLETRNLSQIELRIYQVDLLLLSLKHKEPARITEINLAGINPDFATNLVFKNEIRFSKEKTQISLPLEGQGAWLVIAKAEGVSRSGLIIKSDLKLELDVLSQGGVRARVSDQNSNQALAGVAVRFIPLSAKPSHQAKTDPRGICEYPGDPAGLVVVAQSRDQYAYQELKPAKVDQRVFDYPVQEKQAQGRLNYQDQLIQTRSDFWNQSTSLEKNRLELKKLNF